MTKLGTPDRKNNPEAIPAVSAAEMDSSFFARLRVIDDRMFLKAAAASAVKGQLGEVSEALKALRGDFYEPLLYNTDKQDSIRIPKNPLGIEVPNTGMFTTFVTAKSIWDIVAIALTAEVKSWSVMTEGSFYTSGQPGHKSPFDADRQAKNASLLRQSLDLCAAQASRTYREDSQVLHRTVHSRGSDDISGVFGPSCWHDMLVSLSKHGCQWSDINQVIDAIPIEVLRENEHEYRDTVRDLVKAGNAPCALHMIERHSDLANKLLDSLASSRERSSPGRAMLHELVPKICWTGVDPDEAVKQVEATFAILDRSIGHKDARAGEMYVCALQTMLVGLTCPEYSDTPKSLVAAGKMIGGLIDLADLSFGTVPTDPWPSQSTKDFLRFGNDVPMRDLLETALSQRHSVLVDKLQAHWALDPHQVDMLKVTSGLGLQKTVINDELIQNVTSILKTARRIGIDLNEPFAGQLHETWKRELTKPAMTLHTIAKATKEKEGQLPLLQELVAMGLDPTLTDKRGWKPKVFIADDESRELWDDVVYRFAARQRASDALTEIMSGEPPPKRARIRKPAMGLQ